MRVIEEQTQLWRQMVTLKDKELSEAREKLATAEQALTAAKVQTAELVTNVQNLKDQLQDKQREFNDVLGALGQIVLEKVLEVNRSSFPRRCVLFPSPTRTLLERIKRCAFFRAAFLLLLTLSKVCLYSE